MSTSEVFVVLRSAGERTEAASSARAVAEVGVGSVGRVREVPFALALRRGFEMGVEAGARWTLCLDADVLLRPGAVTELVRAAEAVPANAFGVTGVVADKLLGHVRVAGQHLYRTSLLARALGESSFDPARRRPETVVKKAMARSGHPTIRTDVLMGLHDFEQSYADIFRKVFVHARKHERFMPTAERIWRRLGPDDPDYRVALVSHAAARAIAAIEGAMPGRQDENVRIDRSRFAENVDALLLPMGLAEKPPLDADGIDAARIAALLEGFSDAPEYLRDRPLIEARGGGGSLAMLTGRLRLHGPVAGPVWLVGAALRRGGARLRRLAGDAEP